MPEPTDTPLASRGSGARGVTIDELGDVPPEVLAAADRMRIEFDKKIGGAPLALAVQAYRRGVADAEARVDRSGDALVRQELAEMFRRCAGGRREYAGSADSPDGSSLQAVAELMRIQSATLDAVARVIEGDTRPLYDWLPSHRWTAEMVAALYPERPRNAPVPGADIEEDQSGCH